MPGIVNISSVGRRGPGGVRPFKLITYATTRALGLGAGQINTVINIETAIAQGGGNATLGELRAAGREFRLWVSYEVDVPEGVTASKDVKYSFNNTGDSDDPGGTVFDTLLTPDPCQTKTALLDLRRPFAWGGALTVKSIQMVTAIGGGCSRRGWKSVIQYIDL